MNKALRFAKQVQEHGTDNASVFEMVEMEEKAGALRIPGFVVLLMLAQATDMTGKLDMEKISARSVGLRFDDATTVILNPIFDSPEDEEKGINIGLDVIVIGPRESAPSADSIGATVH